MIDKNLETLYSFVVEAYQNAIENGYDLDTWTAQEVAEDMCTYDSEVENYFIEDVVYCVEHYRKETK
jgi:hypothetical protein